ncbi:MAG: phenylalanine--tRNA ligase beta subunit-related protein [Muribaculaceae bacterium]|nr:phenylalanine--tRNA ligase beta subunit-related protein [Muribaculaceae bacterium]
MNRIAKVEIDDRIRQSCPGYRLLLVECDVENTAPPAELKHELEALSRSFKDLFKIEDIAHRPGIAATRAIYKALGKDPNRYRPSQEQMMRRIVRDLGLYEISAIVDAGNLLSLLTGYSVGAFDADKVVGDTISIGVGMKDEPYEGIGRGPLNVEGLPIVRDGLGGIGTPTSDNERTKTSPSTTRLLMTIHMFGEDMPIADTIDNATRILRDYCAATDIDLRIIS